MFQSHNRCVGTLLSWTKYSVLIWLCEMVSWEIPAILCIRTTTVQMTETQEKRTLNHTLSYLVQGFANQTFFLNIRWSLSRSSHTSAKNGLCPAVQVKNTTNTFWRALSLLWWVSRDLHQVGIPTAPSADPYGEKPYFCANCGHSFTESVLCRGKNHFIKGRNPGGWNC